MNIVLTIGGQYVDLPLDFDILFNYTLEDTNNPSSIKNSCTKSCNLPGTENNDRVFNLFFRNDRMIGNSFDPGKRVPFELFLNGNIEESGYVQLNKVSILGGNKTYSCTLYGGVGDFFYCLDANEDGSKKTLADLNWKIDGASSPENEMDFSINKETIKAAWDRLRLNTSGSTLYDTINFIPLNEGIIGDFDSDKVLINTEGQDIFPTSAGTYGTIDNYALGTLNKKYDWLAMRDIRSYMTRPAVKMSRFFDAICDPDNNGGYEVVLDGDFFNYSKNPYYSDTWMTLPSPNTSNNNEVEKTSDTSFVDISTSANEILNLSGSTDVIVSGDIDSDASGVINISDEVFGYMSIGVNIGLDVSGDTNTVQNYPTLYPYKRVNNAHYAHYFFAQVLAYDADTDELLGGSDIYCFNGGTPPARRLKGGLSAVANEVGYRPIWDANYIDVRGVLNYNPNRGVYEFTDNTYGTHIWQATIEKISKSMDNIKFVVTLYHGSIQCHWSLGILLNFNVNKELGEAAYHKIGESRGSNGYMTDVSLISYSGGVFRYSIPNTISSNAKLNKRVLMTTEPSVLDFLLSFTKSFGLMWEVDKQYKKVYCRTRNNYFTGEVVDIDKIIDWSSSFDIQPNVFESRFYNQVYETPVTEFSKKYSDYWGRTYGNQRIDVGTEFNNEVTEMYEGNSFTSLITARDVSRYYRDYYTSSSKHLPVFVYDGLEYELYKDGVDDTTSSTISPNIIDYSKTVDWYGRAGYDYMPRPVGYIMDSGEKKNVDSKYTLLFFNGFITNFNVDYEPIDFWLTDDLGYMIQLNDNRCWLYTTKETCNGERIAIKMTDLPYFSRYTRTNRYPILSLDFGTPAEVFEDTLSLGNNSNIYQRYWKAYLEDQFNSNSRKVTCNVLLDMSLMDSPLRKFYFFDNSIWVLNKIIDYSPIKHRTTKCEFIRVMDKSDYTDGQIYIFPGDEDEPTGSTSTLQSLADAGYIEKKDVTWQYAGDGVLYTFKSNFPYNQISPESVEDLISSYVDDVHNQFRFESRTNRAWGNYIANIINNNPVHSLPIYKIKNLDTNQEIVFNCYFPQGAFGLDFLISPTREDYTTQNNWYNSTSKGVKINIIEGPDFMTLQGSFKYLNTVTGVTVENFQNYALGNTYEGTFQNASSLKEVSVPYIQASDYMFDGCTGLEKIAYHRINEVISQYNTLVIPSDCVRLFTNCNRLTTIEPVLDISNVGYGGYFNSFAGLDNLTSVRLKGLAPGLTNQVDLCDQAGMYMPNLDRESMEYLIDNAQQVQGDNATLYVSYLEYNNLGGEEGEYIRRAWGKGWNVVAREY